MPIIAGKESKDTGLLVGTGILGWPPSERESGRYGIVTLWTEPINHPFSIYHIKEKPVVLKIWRIPKKQVFCDLRAILLEERKFVHHGDPHRDLKTKATEPGTELILGRGLLFYPSDKSVGIQPYPMKENPWMDTGVLYKLVDQLVTIFIVPNPV